MTDAAHRRTLSPIHALPPEVRFTLRACASFDGSFRASDVAARAGLGVMEVFRHLQSAVDAGLPIQDSADGQLQLATTLRDALRQSTMSALTAHWRAQAVVVANASERAQPAVAAQAVEPRGSGGTAEVGSSSPQAAAAPSGPAGAGAEPDPEPGTSESSSDLARTASEMRARGELDAAAALYARAAGRAAEQGASTRSLAYARQGLRLLESLDDTAARRRARVELLVDTARFQWEATGPGDEFTLEAALATAFEAESLLDETSDAQLAASVLRIQASIHYDIGHAESLEQALACQTEAIRRLQREGLAFEAARLLNDQAAVYVRLGDPVRAHHLLEQSRIVFESHRSDAKRQSAQRELAETDVLLARLPLHVGARPGRERDALDMAIAHATDAERVFGELGDAREQARAWETLGRLERLRNRPDRALDWFQRAVRTQQRCGDVIGLARTAEALAELHAELGRFDLALTLLDDSLRLNVEKGAQMGIEYLAAIVEQLRAAMPEESRAQLGPAWEQLAARLDKARMQAD